MARLTLKQISTVRTALVWQSIARETESQCDEFKARAENEHCAHVLERAKHERYDVALPALARAWAGLDAIGYR